MKHTIQKVSFFILILFFVNTISAQVKIMAKEGEIFNLNELSIILLEKNNKIIVEFVGPTETRHADYKDINIQKDDEILYLNGKKLNSVADLEKMYNALIIGAEMKLGIRRNNELSIITFNKMDPSSLPKRQMIKMTINDADTSGMVQEIEINGKTYKAKNGKVNIDGKEMTVKELLEGEGIESNEIEQ